MKKLLKIFIGVAVVFLVVIVGIAVVAGIMIDRVAKSAIETGGSYALGVETTVDKADVQLMKQAFDMEGLNIANPEGFDQSFLKLGSGGVSVDSVTGSVITIPTLSLHDIEINLLKNDTGSNYQIILDNLKKFESNEKAGTNTPEDGGMKFVINQVDIQNVKVHLQLTPLGGKLTAIDVDLDKVDLKDVGTAGKPVSAGDIIGITVKAIMSAAVNKGGDLFPGDMLGDLQNNMAGLDSLGEMGVSVLSDVAGNVTGEVGKGVGDAAKEATDQVKKGIEDVGKGLGKTIKNPFDKKDDKKDGGG